MNKLNFFSLILFLSCASYLPAADLQSLAEELEKTKEKVKIQQLSDQIFDGDVFGDFLEHGSNHLLGEGPAAERAIHIIEEQRLLETYVEKWKEEAATLPDSKKANYLLAVSGWEKMKAESSGRPGVALPARLKIARENAHFQASFRENSGRWDEVKEENISMPRKALIGFVCAGGKAEVAEITLIQDGKPVAAEEWKQVRISRNTTSRSIKEEGKGLTLNGAGHAPSLSEEDDVFFCYREVEGSVELEATVSSFDAGSEQSIAGLMVRASLDPGAATLAFYFGRRMNGVDAFVRSYPSEARPYYEKLFQLCSDDPAAAGAVIEELLSHGCWETGYLCVQKLLAQNPKAGDSFPDLIRRAYQMSGREAELQTMLTGKRSSDPKQQENSVRALEGMAWDYLNGGDAANTIATLSKLKELSPEKVLPLDLELGLIRCLAIQKRNEDFKAEVRNYFVSKAGLDKIIAEVQNAGSTRLPGLCPNVMALFQAAAGAGVGLDLARELEPKKKQSPPVASVILTLRLASNDPELIRLAQGREFLKVFGPKPAAEELLLAAFQLQQSNDTLPGAIALLEECQKNNADTHERIDTALWLARLLNMQGDSAPAGKLYLAMARTLLRQGSSSPEVLAPILQGLLDAREYTLAAELADNFRKNRSEGQIAMIPGLKSILGETDLQRGRGPMMPVIWTTRNQGGTEIHWEIVSDPLGYDMLNRETLTRGRSIPALDGSYTLEIYTQAGQSFSSELRKEDLLKQLLHADSKGSWSPESLAAGKWLKAKLIAPDGKEFFSPSVPACVGENLVGPVNPAELRKQGARWKLESPWAFCLSSRAGFPENGLFLSRLQTAFGQPQLRSATIQIDPKKSYLFQCFLRTETHDITQPGIVFLDKGGKVAIEWKGRSHSPGNWTLITARFGPNGRGGENLIPRDAVGADVVVMYPSQCEVGGIGFFELATE